jgi:hypothetical protein
LGIESVKTLALSLIFAALIYKTPQATCLWQIFVNVYHFRAPYPTREPISEFYRSKIATEAGEAQRVNEKQLFSTVYQNLCASLSSVALLLSWLLPFTLPLVVVLMHRVENNAAGKRRGNRTKPKRRRAPTGSARIS